MESSNRKFDYESMSPIDRELFIKQVEEGLLNKAKERLKYLLTFATICLPVIYMGFGQFTEKQVDAKFKKELDRFDYAVKAIARVEDRLEKLEAIATSNKKTSDAISGNIKRIASGSTPQGQTDWEPYKDDGGIGYKLRVDTSHANFQSVPKYFISISGKSGHWALSGDGAIYRPQRNQFEVFIRFLHWEKLEDADKANQEQWVVSWLGVELK